MTDPATQLTGVQKVVAAVVGLLVLAVAVPVAAWALHGLWVWGFAWV